MKSHPTFISVGDLKTIYFSQPVRICGHTAPKSTCTFGLAHRKVDAVSHTCYYTITATFTMGKTLRVEYNTLDLPISYSCQTILDTFKNVTEIKVAFLYDLAFPSTLNESNALAQIESNLLQDLALSYGLWNGVACDEVPNGGLYIVKLSSEPQDTPNLMLGTFHRIRV